MKTVRPSDRVVDPRGERLGVALVIALIFALSWLSTIPQIWASWRGAAAVPGWARLLQIFLIAPGVVAVAAAWINGGGRAALSLLGRIVRVRAPAAAWLAALAGPPIVIVGSLLLSNALGFTAIALPAAGDIVAAFAPTFLVYLVLNTEELAWRGYVLPRFQWRWSPLGAALILGVIWAVFHAPYFFMKGGHPGGHAPLLFLIMVVAMSVVQSRLFNASAGSVLLPHLFHQSVNAWAEAVPGLPRFAHSMAPTAITIAVLVIAAIVVAAWPPSMARPLTRGA